MGTDPVRKMIQFRTIEVNHVESQTVVAAIGNPFALANGAELSGCTAMAAGTEKDNRILVVIQLDGGNDGLNTVGPTSRQHYAGFAQS